MSAEYETITLDFEDAESIECEILGVFEALENEYMALMPVGQDEDAEESEVFLYRYVEEGEDEFELLDIEDESEFDTVAAIFDEIMAAE